MENDARPRAVIWDFGSVLVYMEDDAPRLALAARLGVPLERLDALVFDSESARRAAVGELTIGQHWQAVAQALGISQAELPAVINQFWSADALNTDVVAYIQSLRPRCKVGLLSNAWDNLRQTLEQRFGVAHLFDEIIVSAEERLVKPDPRIYRVALQRLGVPPAAAIFVDDLLENVLAARAVGMAGVHFQNAAQAIAEVEAWLSVVSP